MLRNLTVALLLASAPVLAQQQANPATRSFDAVPDKPTPTLNGGITLEGAQLFSPKSFRLAFLLDATDGVMSLNLGENSVGQLIPFRLDAHLLGAYQFLPWFEMAVDIPFTLYQVDNMQLLTENGFPTAGISTTGVDEIRAVPKFMLLDGHKWPVALAIIPELRFPTGDRSSFLGGRGLAFDPRLAVDRTFGKLRLYGDLGYRFQYAGQFLNLYVGNEFVMGAGASYRLPDYRRLTHITALAEMVLATQTAAPFTFSQADSLKSPWELLVGARARWTSRWGVELDLAKGLGTEAGYGRETFRVMAALRYDFEWADRDEDGVPDDIDKCPDQPGPAENEGCPDPDRDHDGIPNELDACPDDPGPAEYDGCPDRDGDQIPDNLDKCPDEPGPAENDGCPITGPAVVLETDRIRLRQNILFETAMAIIKPESFHILDEVADVLAKHPDLKHVQVQGHTDNIGSRPYNLDLSDRRAKSVVEYLVKKGIERRRLTPKGYGFDKPVAPNTNAIGRARNRRVEFNLQTEEPSKGEPKAPPSTETPAEAPAAEPAAPKP